MTWFQTSVDMLTSLDTPAGHGHIYEDELVPLWAAVLHREDAPIDDIAAAIHGSLATIKAPGASATGSAGSVT